MNSTVKVLMIGAFYLALNLHNDYVIEPLPSEKCRIPKCPSCLGLSDQERRNSRYFGEKVVYLACIFEACYIIIGMLYLKWSLLHSWSFQRVLKSQLLLESVRKIPINYQHSVRYFVEHSVFLAACLVVAYM